MIEVVAKAIYLAMYANQGGKWEAVETKDVWHDKAREVLAEMKLPTDKMCAYAKHRNPSIDVGVARGVWWNMIEEALAEKL